MLQSRSLMIRGYLFQTLSHYSSFLETMADLYSTDPGHPAISTLLKKELTSRPDIMDILIVSEEGMIRNWTGSGPPPNLAGRPYFLKAKENSEKKLLITPPALSIVHNNEYFFSLIRPLTDRQGMFRGAVIIHLSVDGLIRSVRHFLPEDNVRISLFDADSMLYFRIPSENSVPGSEAVSADFIRKMTSLTAEKPVRVSSIFDRTPILLTLNQVEGLPLYLGIARPESEILRPVYRESFVLFSLLIIIAGSGFYVLHLFLNQRELIYKAEKETLDTADRLMLTQQASGIGNWYWDAADDAVQWDAVCYRMLGYEPDEFTVNHKNFMNMLHPDDSKEFNKKFAEQSAGRSFSLRFRLRRKDGTYCWIEGRGRVIQSDPEKGNLIYVGTHMDISGTMEIEQKLRAERELFTGGPVAAIIWTPEPGWPVSYVSRNINQICGYTAEEMLTPDFRFSSLIYQGDIDRIAHEVGLAIENKRPFWEQTYRIVTKSGEIRWLYDYTIGEWNPSGILTRIRGYLLDQTGYIETRENLALLESRWRYVLEATGQGVWDYNMSERIMYYSPGWKQMLGIDPQTELTDPDAWKKRIHPDDLPDVIQSIQNHSQNRISFFSSVPRMLCEDGVYRWFRLQGKIIERHENGTALRMIGTMKALTEQEEQESALVKLAANIPGVLFQLLRKSDGGYHLTYVSHGLADLFDVNAGRVMADIQEISVRLHPEDRKYIRDTLESSAENLHPFQAEFRIQNRPSGFIWAEVRATPEKIGASDVIWNGSLFDITEKKKTEMYLREHAETLSEQVETGKKEKSLQETRYRNLYYAIPDALMIHGFDENGLPGRFIEVNDAACTLLESDRKTILSLSPLDIRVNKDKTRLAEIAENLRRTGRSDSEEELYTLKGNKITIERISHIVNVDGNPLVYSILRDIGEKTELRKEQEINRQILIQQSRMAEMGSMIGAIAHQWKQPLNSVSLIAQNIQDLYDYNEITKENIYKLTDDLIRLTGFMSQTVDDFRNFFRPSSEMKPFLLSQAASETLRLLEAQLKKHGIQTEISVTEDSEVTGYYNEFRQVILNLLNNARDAVTENPPGERFIKISIFRQNGDAILETEDSGQGIDDALLPDKLFEPFSSTKGDLGTGIGLSLARKILSKMNGKIIARNTGTGALFRISIPLNQE